jgi:recombination protein RecA
MSIEQLYKKFKIDPHQYMQNTIMGDYSLIPISPQVDLSCGGGVREGSLVIVSGHEKLGKSTFCLQAAANAQNMNDGITRKIYYLDVENKLLKRDLEGIHNLRIDDNFVVLGSSESGPISAEKFFQMAENIVTNERHAIIIFDSFSMLLTQKELDYEFSEGRQRPDVPAYTSVFCKKMSQLIRPSKCTMFGINHVYTSQGAGVSYLSESGGKKIQYAGNYKFRLVSKKPIEEDGSQVGNKVTFMCMYHPSDSGSGEKEKLEFDHRFGYGIDDINDYLELAQVYQIIKKKGAWYAFEEEQMQGKSKLRKKMVEDTEMFNKIKERVLEYIQ